MRKINFKSIKLLLLDFDGVLTDNMVWVSENGTETVKCYRSDGIGISRIVQLGIKVVIISTEKNKVVSERAKKLKLEVYQGVNDKKEVVKKISKKYKIPLSRTAFLGNDINDIPALEVVGFPFGVGDSFQEINNKIIYKTKKNGGHGAVRELCDKIFNSINLK